MSNKCVCRERKRLVELPIDYTWENCPTIYKCGWSLLGRLGSDHGPTWEPWELGLEGNIPLKGFGSMGLANGGRPCRLVCEVVCEDHNQLLMAWPMVS